MKNSILSATMTVLPLCLQAMETYTDPKPELLSEQTMARFFQMNIHDLDELVKNTRKTFETLEEKKIVSFPFTPKQATILAYSYQDSPPEIEGISWDLLSQGDKKNLSVNFFSLLRLASHIQEHQLYEPPARFSFKSNTNNLSPFLKHARKYAIVGLEHRSYIRTCKDNSGIKLTLDSVYKIAKHFRCIQITLCDLPHSSIWGWVKMRYDLEKTTYHFGATPPVKKEVFYEPISSLDLISFDYEKNTNLIKQIETISSFLAKTLGLSILDKEQKRVGASATAQKEHRKILKVLFWELPHLGLLNSLKEYDGYNEFFTFAQLYLDLTKNYKKNPTSSDEMTYPYNISKLEPLLSSINGGPLTLEDVTIVLKDDKGMEILAQILKVFANPFSPTIQELNTFSYYADEISQLLRKKKEALEQAKEFQPLDKGHAPLPEEDSFFLGVRSDLYEFWNVIAGKKKKDN